jgi:putative ABC transport system permease protein
VVGDVHQHALDARPEPEMYRPFAQWALSSMVIMVETDRDPAGLATAVRRTIADVDARIPVVEARPLDDVLGDSLAQRRFFAGVLTCFGLLALLLGGIGVYGVAAYAVSARVPEFSLRVALGATPGQVMADALRAGLLPVLLGLTAGTVAALAVTRVLESLLFGVQPRDPAALAAAALLLGAVALIANWVPARRVRRVEPMNVLNAG